MSSVVEGDVRKQNDVAETSGDLRDATTKESNLPQESGPHPYNSTTIPTEISEENRT